MLRIHYERAAELIFLAPFIRLGINYFHHVCDNLIIEIMYIVDDRVVN